MYSNIIFLRWLCLFRTLSFEAYVEFRLEILKNHEETSVGVAGNSFEIPVITSRIQIRDVTAVWTNFVIRHRKLYLLKYWSFKTFLILSLSSSMLISVNDTSNWETVNSLNTSKGCGCHRVVIWLIFIRSRHSIGDRMLIMYILHVIASFEEFIFQETVNVSYTWWSKIPVTC